MKPLPVTLIALFGFTFSMSVLAGANYPIAIKAGNLGWEFNSSTGQKVSLLDMYTDDAVVIPPSSEILSNHSAIQSFWDEVRQGGIREYEIDTINLHVDGDIAYQTAYWQSSITADNGTVFHIDGTMTNVLERQQNGNWKIRTQSWN